MEKIFDEIENSIYFELEQTEEDKKTSKRMKKQIATKVIIRKGMDKNVGHIFTPSGSGRYVLNAIQVCGFTEAFDLWGCGIYRGFKDIQLLFDTGIMGGVDTRIDMKKCCACFREPCQCENKKINSKTSPFKVKRKQQLKDRVNEKEKKLKEGDGED